MQYTIEPFSRKYLEAALELFIEGYKNERRHNPLLPSRVIDEPEWIAGVLQSRMHNPGVAIVQKNRIIAYMLTGFQFPFKGQHAVLVPEYCHSAVVEDKKELYQRMYMHLAREWVQDHIHVHNIGHFAHDSVLQDSLYHLGFGAILAERLRDFSAVHDGHKLAIVEEQDMSKLLKIQIEHNDYYKDAPIFIVQDTQESDVLAELGSHAKNGDVSFVYYEDNEPCAYVLVGDSARDGEGFLLQRTRTAQIKSAYAQPHVRGKGVGKALVQRAIQWSQQHGYERVFVEHETANFYGGNFWAKHFSPYLYFSMRYIDNTL